MLSSPVAPEGFAPSAPGSPFLDLLGPMFERGDGEDYRLGFRVAASHANRIGQCHGAVLSALADVHLLRMIALTRRPRLTLVTVHLGLDFLTAAKQGMWLEARGRIDRIGRTLCHSSGMITADGTPAARAAGAFRIVAAP